MGGSLVKTDLGHGRGWASPKAAASIRRIDAQLGRVADINEAGRSPEQADLNRAAWLRYERYLNGGPWAPKAPYALGADQSVHCWGDAADSDDWYNPAAAAVWRDNGWRQTARYFDRNGRPTAKDEPWHGEYSEHLDNHRNDPVPAVPVPEEDDMPRYIFTNENQAVNGVGYALIDSNYVDGCLVTSDPKVAEQYSRAAGGRNGGAPDKLGRAEFNAVCAAATALWREHAAKSPAAPVPGAIDYAALAKAVNDDFAQRMVR